MPLTLKTSHESPAGTIRFPKTPSTDWSYSSIQGHERRLESLQEACRILADGFEDLDESIARYLADASRSAYECEADDVENFLQWLAEQEDLTPEERDHVACQKSQQAVERVVLRRRLAHLRFQEMLQTPRQPEHGEQRPQCLVHLNPVHVWATFESHALIADDADLPATVVVFPVGATTRSLVVDSVMAYLIRKLEHYGPLPLQHLLRAAQSGGREALHSRIVRLTELGLLALA